MREWTTQELKVLRDYAPLGRDNVAALLQRSPKAVEWAALVHGVSLKRTDEDVEIRADTIDLLERIREVPSLAVCPMCGKRFARIRATGMCRICHLQALIDAHHESIEEQVRLRRLDKARQDKTRMRVCDRCGRPFYPRTSSEATLCRECGG